MNYDFDMEISIGDEFLYENGVKCVYSYDCHRLQLHNPDPETCYMELKLHYDDFHVREVEIASLSKILKEQ